MNALYAKLKEVLTAIIPIVALVLVLSFTLAPAGSIVMARFLLGIVAIIVGLTFLLHGVDLAFLPMGSYMGKALLTSNKLWFTMIASSVIGFFIVFAEPSVQVLSAQVASVTHGLISESLIRLLIAIGSGFLLSMGITRIVKGFSIRISVIVLFAAILLISLLSSSGMLGIAFDAAGSATGAVTVPFILALAMGSSAMGRDSKTAEENSFGLVGITALGAVIGVLCMGIFLKPLNLIAATIAPEAPSIAPDSLFGPFLTQIPPILVDSFFTLLPITIILFIFQIFHLHLHKKAFRRILMGLLYAFAGLFLFFTGVNAGFMDIVKTIGFGIASKNSGILLIVTGFTFGMLIVLTEPAVYVFTHKIEDLTSGFIRRKTVLVFLAAGVSVAVALSMLRVIVHGLQFWHYLLPCFAIITVLMFFTPKLFVGIGFDSGAVSAGPMTAAFVLSFVQGVSEGIDYSDMMADSFGVVAMVTILPIIALQLLGVIYGRKLKGNERKPHKNGV